MRKILAVPAMTLGMALLASCNLNSSDSGKNEVSNFEDLPSCSQQESFSGSTPLGEKVRVGEEDVSYLCTDSGWVVVSVAEYQSLPACPAKRGANLGLKVYVDADSLQYICVSTGWIEYDSTATSGKAPSPTADSSLVSGTARAIGPFEIGSVVELREVLSDKDAAFILSDSVFKGLVTGKTGEYMIPKVTTYAKWGVVAVKGTYKDALTGEASEDTLELDALVDLTSSGSVQVDVFSLLVAARVETLVNSGAKISTAKIQAEKELVQTFGFDPNAIEDAVRLAGALLLRSDLDEAGFANAIGAMVTDFAEDGTWDNDETRTALADFAFNIQNLKIKDEKTGEIVLKESDYRKNLEKFGIKDVAAFEALFTDFWVTSYGLGGCGAARQNVVVKNANESSDSSNAYFICDNEKWNVATDFQRDTVNLGNAEDGVLHEGNVNDKKLYVYDTTGFGIGQTVRWKKPDSIVLVIGYACTDFEDVAYKVVSTKDEDDDVNYYGCKNRSWTSSISEMDYEIGYLCNKSAKNVAEKYKHGENDAYARCHEFKQEADGVVTYSYSWVASTKLDYEHSDEECTPYEVKGKDQKYYCTDADKIKFVKANEAESELGVCYKAVAGKFGTYKGEGDKDVYVICSEVSGMYSWTATDALTYKMRKVCNADNLGPSKTPDESATYTCGCQVTKPIEPTPAKEPYTETVILTTKEECSVYPLAWYENKK